MRSRGALAGLACAALALGVAELVSVLTGPRTSPLVAVGGAVVDATPEPVKEFAIRTFGANDKNALLLGTGLLLAACAAVLGTLAVRRPLAGYAGLGLFGLLGAVAALTRPGAGPAAALPSLIGVVAAAGALRFTLRSDGPQWRVDRRGVLIAFGAAALAGLAGFRLARRDQPVLALPEPVSAGPAGTDMKLPELTSFVTPNDTFYRVDTALVIPRLDPGTYRLRITGMVGRPLTLTLDDLLARGLVEREITLTCVSNEVGGELAGNARWLGVPLRGLLGEARPRAGADQVVGRSADGWTAGTPLAACLDGRDALLAVGMNGTQLPPEHGFPVRMIVPGLYGYVSATKWLTELELSTFAAFDPYWVRRGWAEQAPIKTFSRIDTPRPFARPRAGLVTVAGVAWAQRRGISRVQVRADGGAWQEASLGTVGSIDTWRQWAWRWEATPGRHTLEVRAADTAGEFQPGERRAPFPDGATGWHAVVVMVSA
ncbi:molybdopterin-dependent oxidoreductase [Longispora albida]|uniref:molybdopterin-dependent oxidoreductase n=1 Tax=Longispora albida TaxID=203523 RepID=UPI003CCBA349